MLLILSDSLSENPCKCFKALWELPHECRLLFIANDLSLVNTSFRLNLLNLISCSFSEYFNLHTVVVLLCVSELLVSYFLVLYPTVPADEMAALGCSHFHRDKRFSFSNSGAFGKYTFNIKHAN